VLSYLVNKANSFLTANVFFSGFFTQAAGTSGPIPYTGYPPPDDESHFAWVEITNAASAGGQAFVVSTLNSPNAGTGLTLAPGEKIRIEQPKILNFAQAINGQLWPFGGTSVPIIDNTAGAAPAEAFVTWGGVK
jgi:hypothetical protein